MAHSDPCRPTQLVAVCWKICQPRANSCRREHNGVQLMLLQLEAHLSGALNKTCRGGSHLAAPVELILHANQLEFIDEFGRKLGRLVQSAK